MIMRASLVVAITAVATAMAACRRDALDVSAPNASPPPIRVAVGPVPGPVKTMPMAANPYAGNGPATAEGRVLFNQFNCGGCHGDHAGGGMGPSLRDVDWLYGNADAQIFDTIAEGRGKGMPAWGTRLNDDQIWKLVAYIKSLRTPAEPDRPEP